MNDVNPYEYTITVRQIEEEGERVFEATIAEFPDAADYAETYVEAYELAVITIQATAELYAESGKLFPNPIKREGDFSGRVTLRMPKTIHAKANRIAEQEGVSLNQFIVATIAENVGGTDTLTRIERRLDVYLRKTATTISDISALNKNLNFGDTFVNSGSGNIVNLEDRRISR